MTFEKDEKDRAVFCDYYQGWLGGKLFRWLDRRKVRIIKRVLAELGEGLRVVDLGCGAAGISSRLVGALPGIRVIGVDNDARLLDVAQRRGLEVKLGDLDKPLPVEPGSCDVVLMIDTLEHVQCRKETMAEVKRILTERGVLVVFTPAHDTVSWTLGVRVHTFITRRTSFDHISPFTKESLSWYLKQNFAGWHVGHTNFGLTLYGIGRGKTGKVGFGRTMFGIGDDRRSE